MALPVVIIGGILAGIFTATEAGVTAVVYAVLVGCFVYRELQLVDLPRILASAAMTSFGLLFIVANASMFGWVLAREEFPRLTVGFLLYLTCAMTETPISEALRYILPFVMAMLVVVVFVAYIPQISLFVPQLVFGK